MKTNLVLVVIASLLAGALLMYMLRPAPVAAPAAADDKYIVVENEGEAPGTPVGVSAFNTHAGPYGLGVTLALGRELRPFRRLITSQALFRREVFQ